VSVGLVIVSHSAKLAEGVVELAREMGGEGVAIEAAGGMADPPGAMGTAAARNGKAEATTTRLIDLLRITACSAANRNAPISSGSRNSAPPRPIKPPNAPITAPPINANGMRRVAAADNSVVSAGDLAGSLITTSCAMAK